MKNNLQFFLFDTSESASSDVTLYEFNQVAPQKNTFQYNGLRSFDRISGFIKENKASGVLFHQATQTKTIVRNGNILSLVNFPIIN